MAASLTDRLLAGANCQLSSSPRLTPSTITAIEETETKGIPLNTGWTFWLDRSIRGTSAAEYEAALRKLYTVSTVQVLSSICNHGGRVKIESVVVVFTEREKHYLYDELGFWSVYNNIPTVSELNTRYTYHLMRHDRKPLWEEDYHSMGGNWRLKCQKKDTEDIWKELLLAAIGENLSDCMASGDEVSGLTVSIRERDDVIQIWNVRAALYEQSTIVNRIKDLMPDISFSAIFYKAFQTHQAFEGDKPGSKG